MSYEGRYQVICENGHYDEWCALTFSYLHGKCEDCGAKFKEVNSVDDTNEPNSGYDYGMKERAEDIKDKNRLTHDGCKILYSFKV